MNEPGIYLDHAATTRPEPAVLDAIRRSAESEFGNASSVHAFGRDARRMLEESREKIAGALHARNDEIVFMSGGTESDNTALFGVAVWAREAGRDHLIVSTIEHHAVLHSADALQAQGFTVTRLPVDASGQIDLSALRSAVSAKTMLVSVIHANNEVGTIQPIAEVSAIAHRAGALVHTDAVQSFGKIPVHVDDLGADLLTISAHKLYGPKGIGALYIRKGTRLTPMTHGGGQEAGRRAGTENVPLAVGFGVAVEISEARREADAIRMGRLREAFADTLRARVPDLLFNGSSSHALPTILNVSFDRSKRRIDGDALIMGLDLRGIAVTSGSACTSGSLQASHVLLAMGRDPETARATVRFSLGRSTTKEDLDRAADALVEVVAGMEMGRK